MSMNSVQMEPEAEQPNRTFYQGTNALYFIHIQLVELTRDCDKTLQNGLVSINFFFKLQNELEKILYETRAACNPPLRKPAIGDFEILRCVGRGTFGTVDLMDHRQTGQAFAVKTIRCEKVTRKFQARALMERDILTFCDNPFIVSMFCSFETETDLHIVMEYIGGGNCVTLLERYGRLPATIARLYTAEVVLAVEYIHNYGILHRDLKPSNLLISSTGHIKLADFGLSKICPLNTKTELREDYVWKADQEFVDSEMVGTLLYMAPEVIQYMTYGKPVDWWALGIILYEFLVGRVPFIRKPGQKIFELVNNEEVTWPEGSDALQTDVQDVIGLLLQKDSMKRLGTGGAGEVKEHSFFQGLDWSNLHNQDVPLIEEEWNMTQSSESCSEGGSSDSSQSSNESSDGGSTDDGSSNEDSSYESSSDDEDLLPEEVVDFCSVAFCFKEVYGSPKQLSLCDVLSASAQRNKVGEDQKEEQEQKSQHEVDESVEGVEPEDLQDEAFKQVLESILDPVPEQPDGGLVPGPSVLSVSHLVDGDDSEAFDGGEEIRSEGNYALSADSQEILSEAGLATAQSSEPPNVDISSHHEESSEDSSSFVLADDGLPEEITSLGSMEGGVMVVAEQEERDSRCPSPQQHSPAHPGPS